MRKRKNTGIPGDRAEEIELSQELERLVNENNALMKVLKKITSDDKSGSENRIGQSKNGKNSK